MTACGSPGATFDLSRARRHIDTLAGDIGRRPIGTPQNAAARAYLTGELRTMGFDVRVQQADAVDAERGITARVFNIIAVRDGAVPDAIALVSHYDSVPQAPGALDDALGVAASLEAARALSQDGMRHSLMVLITDAEEVGLMGARALVTDPQVKQRLRAFLNFDGTGAAGPGVLFETGPGWGAPLSAWAGAASRPAGGSFAFEIYRRIPNDTDFTILRQLGASGLNFAPVVDSYAYHTDRDVPSRVRPDTLRHEGENAVAIVRALDRRSLDGRTETPTFFAAAGHGVVYGPRWNTGIAGAACLAGVLVWLWCLSALWRRRGVLGVVVTAGWAVAVAVVPVLLMVGGVWLLRAVRVELTPWYASPIWMWSFIVSVALTGIWLIGRLAARVGPKAAPDRGPIATWSVTLPLWIALAGVVHVSAPAASYLFAVPLLVAALALAASRGRDRLVRAASVVACAVVALLWVHNTWLILGFVVPLLGWMSIGTPAWMYPALFTVPGLLLLPPLRAALAGRLGPRVRPAAAGGVLLFVVAITGAGAATMPAYTPDRPLRRSVRYVQDQVQQTAWWEVGSAEPAIDLGPQAPEPWERVTTPPPARVTLWPIDRPFAFRAETTPLVSDVPAEIDLVQLPATDGLARFEITVRPRRPLQPLILQLPAEAAPVESSVAGRMRGRYWRATYYGAPSSGLTIQLAFSQLDPDALARAAVLLVMPGLPGSAGGDGLPPWLSNERTAWNAQSIFVLPLRR